MKSKVSLLKVLFVSWASFANPGFFPRFKACLGDKSLRSVVGAEWSSNLVFEKRSLEESGIPMED